MEHLGRGPHANAIMVLSLRLLSEAAFSLMFVIDNANHIPISIFFCMIQTFMAIVHFYLPHTCTILVYFLFLVQFLISSVFHAISETSVGIFTIWYIFLIGIEICLYRHQRVRLSARRILPHTPKITVTCLDTKGECSICLEPCGTIDGLGCEHIYFHKECLETWFQRSRTCPLCRCTSLAVTQ